MRVDDPGKRKVPKDGPNSKTSNSQGSDSILRLWEARPHAVEDRNHADGKCRAGQEGTKDRYSQ